MAGGISKVLGTVLTVVGILALAGGLGLAAFGASQVESETRQTVPDEDRAGEAGDMAAAGMMLAGFALVVLLLSIPLLVWGFHRERNAEGKVQTRRGGALTAWAVGLLVVGTVLAAVGAASEAYGAAIAAERGSVLGDESRGNMADGLANFGYLLLASGIVAFALGLVFSFAAALRGRGADRRPGAAGPGRSSAASRLSSPTITAGVLVAGVVLVAFLALALAGEGPGAVALESLQDREAESQEFNGRLQGVAGAADLASPRAAHDLASSSGFGSVVAMLNWAGGMAPPDEVALSIELETSDGGWRTVARSVGTNGAAVAETGMESFPGRIRVVLTAVEDGAVDTDYRLVVVVHPR